MNRTSFVIRPWTLNTKSIWSNVLFSWLAPGSGERLGDEATAMANRHQYDLLTAVRRRLFCPRAAPLPAFFLLPSEWAGVPRLWPHPGRAPGLSAPVPAALPHPRPADLILCWQLPAKVMHWVKHPLPAPSAPSHRRVLVTDPRCLRPQSVFLLRRAQALRGHAALLWPQRVRTPPSGHGKRRGHRGSHLGSRVGAAGAPDRLPCFTLTLVTRPWRVPRKGQIRSSIYAMCVRWFLNACLREQQRGERTDQVGSRARVGGTQREVPGRMQCPSRAHPRLPAGSSERRLGHRRLFCAALSNSDIGQILEMLNEHVRDVPCEYHLIICRLGLPGKIQNAQLNLNFR